MGWFNEPERPMQRGEQHQAFPVLRNAVIGAIDYFVPYGVSYGTEYLDKVLEHPMTLKCGDVLHRQYVRAQCLDEAGEFVKEAPLTISLVIVALTVGRKWLAWSAAGEYTPSAVGEQRVDIVGRKPSDVLLDEQRSVVSFVWIATGRIQVDASRDGQPLKLESIGESSRTAKQVYTRD